MKKNKSFAVLAACGLLLSACSTPGPSNTSTAGASQSGRPAVAQGQQEVGAGKRLLVQVPAANNPLSNAMIVGMLASGKSTGSVRSIQLVLGVPGSSVGIAGRSQSVNVATLKRALKDYPGSSSARVYIDATPEQIAELRQLAEPKGIVINGGR